MLRSISLRWLLGFLIALLVASPVAAIACEGAARPVAMTSMITRGDCGEQRSRPACVHACDVICTILAPAPFAVGVQTLDDDLRHPSSVAALVRFVGGPEPPPPRN